MGRGHIAPGCGVGELHGPRPWGCAGTAGHGAASRAPVGRRVDPAWEVGQPPAVPGRVGRRRNRRLGGRHLPAELQGQA
eukprot:4022222-Lingulodinium_polyedra.AAC.1